MIGVIAGTITAMVILAKRVAHPAEVSGVVDPDNKQAVHVVTGELFFASSNDPVHRFDYRGDPDAVVETGYAALGKKVTIVGLNEPSAKVHGNLGGELTSH